MTTSRFTHLHVASSHSLRFGTSTPDALVSQAAQLGFSALALTDRDSLAGAVSFIQSCQKHDISPILGVEIALRNEIGTALSPASVLPTPVKGGRAIAQERPRVLVYANDAKSWAGLCEIVSRAHSMDPRSPELFSVRPQQASEPGLTRSELMQICGTYQLQVLLGPKSDFGRTIAARRPDRALAIIEQWQSHDIAPFIEIVTHQESPEGEGLSDIFAARMLQWAIAHRQRAVLTNAVRYVSQDQSRIADVLDAARQQVALRVAHRLGSTSQAHLANEQQMHQTALRISNMVGDSRDIAGALLTQTQAFAQNQIIAPDALGLGKVFVPELTHVFRERIALRDETVRESANDILRSRCLASLPQYLERNPDISSQEATLRLEDELALIGKMNFADYLLTVSSVVDMVRDMKIRVAARGSGAGSFINHLLGISGVDPIRNGLLMERFISTLRPGLPDIDIDVESARRLEIYDAVFARFGAKRTACVSMYETYRVRHAIRDVGAALSLAPGDINTFAKSFPHIRARQVRSALAELPELNNSGLTRMLGNRAELFLDLVEGLDGLPRHIAMHPCAVVLSDESLLARTPIQPSAGGYPMTQFDKDDVEHMGLLKLDILGVRMQSALAHALVQVEETSGEKIDLDNIDLSDTKTFELIASTKTLGCFQIESPGQRELIGKFAPREFGDLTIDISLFRPGPVKSDMITPFLRARHNWEAPKYLHPDLIPALAETYGVVVFHEQVMRVISIITGCSLEQADLVRRTMGQREQIDSIRQWFYRQAGQRGYQLAVIEEIWEVLRAFASFGFCKAHAAAFAVITYQSAWLKAHHPAAFLAAVLTHDPGMYPKRLILDEARSLQIPILGLDVNASQADYVVEPTENQLGIRISLADVKGIDEHQIQNIIAGRPYTSLADFVARSGAAAPTIDRLIQAGGFDNLHCAGRCFPNGALIDRRDLLLHAKELISDLRSSTRKPKPEQSLLSLDVLDWQPKPSGLPPMSLAQRVRAEVEVLGLDLSAHVMDFYLPMLKDISAAFSSQLLHLRSQSNVLVAGVKVATQTPPIRSGRRVAFITLDDSTGPVDATFFDDSLFGYAPTLFHSWLLLVSGTIRRTGPRGISILANGCWELSSIYQEWLTGGAQGVLDLVTNSTKSHRQQLEAMRNRSGQEDSQYDEVTPTRVWEHASGFLQSPYSDVRPAGNSLARGMSQGARMAPT